MEIGWKFTDLEYLLLGWITSIVVVCLPASTKYYYYIWRSLDAWPFLFVSLFPISRQPRSLDDCFAAILSFFI